MKIKFGAIVTDGRGKIGGHVASKNRGGAYLRTKVTPSNPNTTAQAIARGLLASLSQAWRSLDGDTIKAWNSAVKDFASTDIFGDIKNPTGLNLYVKLNANLLAVGLTPLVLPPAKLEVPTATITSGNYDISTGVLSFSLSDASADTIVALVRATPPVSGGVSYVKNAYRVIGNDVVASNAISLTGAYVPKFGALVDTDNVFCSVQFVLASGQKTVESSVKIAITA